MEKEFTLANLTLFVAIIISFVMKQEAAFRPSFKVTFLDVVHFPIL